MKSGFYKRRKDTNECWACPIGAMIMCIDPPSRKRMGETDGLYGTKWSVYLSGFITGYDGNANLQEELDRALEGMSDEDRNDFVEGFSDGEEVYICLSLEYGTIYKIDEISEEEFAAEPE